MVFSVDTAARIERGVAHAHVQLVERLATESENRLGAAVRRFGGDVTATRVTTQPEVQWLQHVTGLTPHETSVIGGVLAWYAEHDLHPRFELAPAHDFAPLAAALAERGFHQTEFIDLLWAPVRAAGAGRDDLADVQVVRVEPGSSDAVDFARVLLAGHGADEAPPEHAAALASLADVDGRSCYLARVDNVSLGAAILTVLEGVGYLANASTVPDARGRGAQQALIARRIADAAAAGCDVMASLANPWTSSHRNIERAGLRVAYTKISWTRVPSVR
jgi:GNAT superfamily N-acetyltransferase